MLTSEFDYDLPDHLIAQEPIEPRDSSRLLDTRDLSDRGFSDLPSILRSGDLLVVNKTRVRPARLIGSKSTTGGRVEVLLLKRLDDGNWDALVRPARRLRRGVHLRFGEIEAVLVSDPENGSAVVALDAPVEIEEALTRWGEIPLPPYINRSLDDPGRYQTLWAEAPGSAAAPTAGLHFTPRLMEAVTEAGVETATIELEIGLDTFRPISVDRITDHRMHREVIRVDGAVADAVERTRQRRGRVVAVGTTSVRALEAAAAGGGLVSPLSGETDLFLHPGAEFSVVDALVTNFHMPRSSLIVMIAGFMGPGWRTAYEVAVERGYRFLSFGDAMFCERWS